MEEQPTVKVEIEEPKAKEKIQRPNMQARQRAIKRYIAENPTRFEAILAEEKAKNEPVSTAQNEPSLSLNDPPTTDSQPCKTEEV